MLSLVAGAVNVAGFLAVQRLTTNVTGHFAFFVDEVFKLNAGMAMVYFLYIFFFFLGSFVSGLLIEIISGRSEHFIFVTPVVIECIILATVGLLPAATVASHPDGIAFSLLFAMGLQNSLVTTISNSAVRTTHLTGLFTDLGIELSQMFFYKAPQQQRKLRSKIGLRVAIISCFFMGGVSAGVLYSGMGNQVLVLAALVLLGGLIYDYVRFRVIVIRRRLRSRWE